MRRPSAPTSARVRVKICGVTRAQDAGVAVRAGADAIGINFWPGSKRFVRPGNAPAIRAEVPEGILCVGVFVNASREEIEQTIESLRLDAVQLHGDEPPEACEGLPVPVIKALRAGSATDLPAEARRYRTEFLLLDAAVPGRYGGTGTAFAWELAREVAPGRLFLAGGLGPQNVAAAVRAVRPWAVDVASGVETSPGVKDRELVEEFIGNAKSA